MRFRSVNITDALMIAVLIAVFLPIFCKHVPFNMDEFLAYHAFSCRYYPENALHIFREGCGQYDLDVLGLGYLPLRSFRYVGSIPALFYYPFFELWKSPWSLRLFGLVLLALQAFMLYKIFKIRWLWCFIFLIGLMPYTFQHMVDTGPVALQITSVFLLVILVSRWRDDLCEEKKWAWLYPILIGLTVFVGVWIKLTYFFIIVPLAMVLLFVLLQRWKDMALPGRWAALSGGMLAAAIVGTLTILLLCALDKWQHPYYEVMTGSGKIVPWQWRHVLANFYYGLANYFTNPITAAHYLFVTPAVKGPLIWSWEGIAMLGMAGIFFVYGLIALLWQRKPTGFVWVALLASATALYVMSQSLMTWAMHHVVLVYPFVLLGIFYIASKLRPKWILAVFLALSLLANASLYRQIPGLVVNGYTFPPFGQINRFLVDEFKKEPVIIILDWGLYYLQALYGNKDQAVLYVDPPMHSSPRDYLKNILELEGKTFVFVGYSRFEHTRKFIEYMAPVKEKKMDFNPSLWKVWYLE